MTRNTDSQGKSFNGEKKMNEDIDLGEFYVRIKDDIKN